MSIVPDSHGRGLVTKFDNAAQNFAFKGAAHPDDWDLIEEAYDKAKARLIRRLDQRALEIVDLKEHLADCVRALGYDPWDRDPNEEHEK